MTSLLDLAIQVLTFGAVFALVLLGQRSVSTFFAVRRRLAGDVSPLRESAPSILKLDGVNNRFLQWVGEATAPKNPDEQKGLRRDLSFAGFDQPAGPALYVVTRFSLAIGLPLALIGILTLAGRPLVGLAGVIFPLLLCGIGLVGPKAFITQRANARRLQMANEFPDALDLIVVCVEAGLGLEAAFVRVANEVTESHPRVAEELGRLAHELSAGRSRADALRALADRVDVDSVKSFVALLIQTDTLGVSIAQSLRTYSAEMRETRFLKAEEKAMRIPVLMTVPIVACFMPVIIVALLLPPVIDVIRTLTPALKGVVS